MRLILFHQSKFKVTLSFFLYTDIFVQYLRSSQYWENFQHELGMYKKRRTCFLQQFSEKKWTVSFRARISFLNKPNVNQSWAVSEIHLYFKLITLKYFVMLFRSIFLKYSKCISPDFRFLCLNSNLTIRYRRNVCMSVCFVQSFNWYRCCRRTRFLFGAKIAIFCLAE